METSTPSPTSPPTGCLPTPASPLQAGCQLCSSFRGSLWKRLQLSWLQTSESACDGWRPGKMARGQVQAEGSGTQDLPLSPHLQLPSLNFWSPHLHFCSLLPLQAWHPPHLSPDLFSPPFVTFLFFLGGGRYRVQILGSAPGITPGHPSPGCHIKSRHAPPCIMAPFSPTSTCLGTQFALISSPSDHIGTPNWGLGRGIGAWLGHLPDSSEEHSDPL